MVIKTFLLLIFLFSWEALAAKSEAIYQKYQDLGQKILSQERMSPEVHAEKEQFENLKDELGNYKEAQVEELNEKVSTHLKNLQQLVFHRTKAVFIDFISWQRELTLKGPDSKSTLIVTNRGWCGGGLLGQSNQYYHYFVDGCFLFGEANVSSEKRNVTYKEGNIPTWGAKLSPGVGMFVSSTKVEFGFKLPIMYVNQTFSKPNQSQFSGYKVREDSPLSVMGSIYARWPFQEFFFQSEFAKIIGNDLVLYSLGLGMKF
ncbi:MAG: hypothetical protein AB7I27_06605 [Bacteriovoracaceae bacterium]